MEVDYEQLEEKLKEKIHADLTDRVSLENEKELFLGPAQF